MQLNEVINLYVEITKECPISTLGPPFTYYHSDHINSNIMATDLIELDVKSAFPTICRLYFGNDHPFIQQLNRIENKLDKNIFISTTLKKQSEVDGKPYLNELNLWSKILILGYIYCKYDNVNILQYVKDGAILKGEIRNSITPTMDLFLQYIVDNKIIYHEIPIVLYMRFNKTTILKYSLDSKISIKGKFKIFPKFINNTVLEEFFNGNIYDNNVLTNIKNKYNKLFFSILYNSQLKEDIDYYYLINNKYLNIKGDLDILENISPKMYLLQIIYPILSLLRNG